MLISGLRHMLVILGDLFNHPVLYLIIATLGTIGTFLFGSLSIGYALGTLIFLDCVTGWMKARQNGEKPNSSTFGWMTFAKVFVYLIVFITMGCLHTIAECNVILTEIWDGFQYFVIWWIASREALSILENLDEGYGDKLPVIRRIYRGLTGITKKVEGLLKESDDGNRTEAVTPHAGKNGDRSGTVDNTDVDHPD